MNRFYDRIDPISDINLLSEKVCTEYSLGKLHSTTIIEIGYEDFNAIIDSSTGKYVMKVFRNSRHDNEAWECVLRTDQAFQIGVPTPRVYRNSHNDVLTIMQLKNNNRISRYRLALIEYIDGKDYFTMGIKPTVSELESIVDIASKLSTLDYRPTFIDDPWSITSFLKEYEKKWMFLSPEIQELLKPIFRQFQKFDGRDLPKAFVHGDMMSTNLMRDSKERIWLIDFSVSNYTFRMIEIIIICGDVAMIHGNKELSEDRIRQAFSLWCSKVDATNDERQSFQLFFSVANAINVMNSSCEISNGNNSEETKMHLEMGLFGLTLFS